MCVDMAAIQGKLATNTNFSLVPRPIPSFLILHAEIQCATLKSWD